MNHGDQSCSGRPRPSLLPLSGLKVLDFSNLLPGPMATLILAEAGADVIKVERPPVGDEMRAYAPTFGDASVNFALLNRGKQGLWADLKSDRDRSQVQALARSADVLVEQFRPGVMDRLALGYADIAPDNPGLIYCSITGYGQAGMRAQKAGHDLNYLAETGLLGLTRGSDGAPVLPPVLAADIGGGAYPAVINILLSLQSRRSTGRGCHLDISMCDNLFTFGYWGLGAGMVEQDWPQPGSEMITGGSPRYQIYRCADGQYLAAAPLEERFWQLFCDRIGLAPEDRDDTGDPDATRLMVAALIAGRTADEWRRVFDEVDACVSVVVSMEEAVRDPAFASRRLFSRTVAARDHRMPALPIPVVADLRDPRVERAFPAPHSKHRHAYWGSMQG